MPVVYKCSRCGCTLFDSRRPRDYGWPRTWGVPTPSEIAAIHGGRCPCCGARLGEKPAYTAVYIRVLEKRSSTKVPD